MTINLSQAEIAACQVCGFINGVQLIYKVWHIETSLGSYNIPQTLPPKGVLCQALLPFFVQTWHVETKVKITRNLRPCISVAHL